MKKLFKTSIIVSFLILSACSHQATDDLEANLLVHEINGLNISFDELNKDVQIKENTAKIGSNIEIQVEEIDESKQWYEQKDANKYCKENNIESLSCIYIQKNNFDQIAVYRQDEDKLIKESVIYTGDKKIRASLTTQINLHEKYYLDRDQTIIDTNSLISDVESSKSFNEFDQILNSLEIN